MHRTEKEETSAENDVVRAREVKVVLDYAQRLLKIMPLPYQGRATCIKLLRSKWQVIYLCVLSVQTCFFAYSS
jgi:hypothetical protein